MPDITFPAPESHVPGYLAVPDGQGPWPGVVVVQDVLGMTTDLRRITDRLAACGYLAMAPALLPPRAAPSRRELPRLRLSRSRDRH